MFLSLQLVRMVLVYMMIMKVHTLAQSCKLGSLLHDT